MTGGAGEIRSSAELPGSAERVWQELTAFATFPAWNPFIRRAEGALVVGSRLRIRLRLDGLPVPFRPTLTVVDPPYSLRWLAAQPIRGLFDVDRRFEITPLGPDRCRLTQSETATGLLAPLLLPLGRRPILAGYRAFEAALRTRVAAPPSRPPHLREDAPMTDTRRRVSNGLPHQRSDSSSAENPPPIAPAGGAPLWKRRISSHETFAHDSIDSLGYDWERISNPTMPPRFPRKIYLPQTTEDIVAAVREAKQLGERLSIRSKGHSSNDLVLTEGGSMLLTEKLDGILEVDREAMTATIQAGAVSAQVDDHLSELGLGLPVIGDHNHITAGGFASVGGISPASHRFGLFVDQIERLQYVTWDGDLVACSREENRDDFHKVLCGLGRHGVMATLTVRLIEIDKYRTVLKNHQQHHWDVEAFISGAAHAIRNPGEAQYERGVWIDFPRRGGGSFGMGQFSAYHPTDQTAYAKARDRLSYDALHGLGYVGGRLPARVDRALKLAGMTGVLFSPMYATVKNVEFFTDKVLDSTVGDPTRMFIVLAPLDRFEQLFRETYELMRRYRTERDCFTFISVYVKSITSEYLATGGRGNQFCELMFYQGMSAGGMDEQVLEELVTELDDICIAHDGFRYMHTKTSKDPARRDKVDPNVHWTRLAEQRSATTQEEVLGA
ncbi:FAD-binding protein [Blastococcus xanthinilyticus]|uniref:Polyketide cyclase/dehydrase/lipid transport protein n=1 Tax=Blastococcus xanthinilyticus TaxID=1564164 RepID=A0A5S5D145_9ACTN|nr:FAD-binding protein [Blastococcus xanthinilyticus]TYP88978.1 polyketide cyclase/dehydrase/lipid transport protein [Blastococcus xanthinilyticus]